MNFKEKMSKQNNSVKMLLRKLKRHDTVVVAIAVVIALVLCGGLIYLTTPAVTASAKEEFEESEKENNEKTIEKLDELSEYLTGLDKSLEESQKSISSFGEKNGTDSSIVSEKVTGLGNDMSSLHTTITSTQTNIEKLKETIEKGTEQSSKERSDSLAQIDKELDEIKKQYSRTQENTKSLIDELQARIKSGDESITKEMNDRYTDLLKKLGALNTQLTDDNSKALDSFKTEIGNLDSEIKGLAEKLETSGAATNSKIDSMNESLGNDISNMNEKLGNNITSLNSSMDNNFNALNTSITNQITTIAQGQSDNTEELKQLLGEYHQSVTDSFTSVANGKQLVASALATKNVQVANDASFEEIYNAITSIQTEIKIEEIVGEVDYTYHHHTNGEDGITDNGEIHDDQYGDEYLSSVQSGCFTRPYYHISYSKPMYRKYVMKSATNDKGQWFDYWGCNYCSSSKAVYRDYPGWEKPDTHRCGTSTVDKWTFEPTEEEAGNVVEIQYARGCDKLANQITGAHITY